MSSVTPDTTYLWEPVGSIKYGKSGSTFSQVTFSVQLGETRAQRCRRRSAGRQTWLARSSCGPNPNILNGKEWMTYCALRWQGTFFFLLPEKVQHQEPWANTLTHSHTHALGPAVWHFIPQDISKQTHGCGFARTGNVTTEWVSLPRNSSLSQCGSPRLSPELITLLYCETHVHYNSRQLLDKMLSIY